MHSLLPWLDSEENIMLLIWSPDSGGDEHKKQSNEEVNQINTLVSALSTVSNNQLDVFILNFHWKK